MLFLHAVSSDSAWSHCNTKYHFISSRILTFFFYYNRFIPRGQTFFASFHQAKALYIQRGYLLPGHVAHGLSAL